MDKMTVNRKTHKVEPQVELQASEEISDEEWQRILRDGKRLRELEEEIEQNKSILRMLEELEAKRR